MPSKQALDMAGLRLFLKEKLAHEADGQELVQKAVEAQPGVAQANKKRHLHESSAALTSQQRRWLESHIRSHSVYSEECFEQISFPICFG